MPRTQDGTRGRHRPAHTGSWQITGRQRRPAPQTEHRGRDVCLPCFVPTHDLRATLTPPCRPQGLPAPQHRPAGCLPARPLQRTGLLCVNALRPHAPVPDGVRGPACPCGQGGQPHGPCSAASDRRHPTQRLILLPRARPPNGPHGEPQPLREQASPPPAQDPVPQQSRCRAGPRGTESSAGRRLVWL